MTVVERPPEHNGVMHRRAGMALLLLVVLAGSVLGWVACSDGDSGGAPAATSPTSGPSPEPTTVPTTGTGPATGTSGSPTTPDSHPATVAMAEGWRFAVTLPEAGATVGRSITVCTEISGTSREPVLEIEAALARRGAPGSSDDATGVDVGRDSVVVEFPNAAPGRYDLELRLNVDGRSISGLRVAIPGLRVTTDTPPADCG